MLLNLNWFYRDLGVRLGISPSFLPHAPDPCSHHTQCAVNLALETLLVACSRL